MMATEADKYITSPEVCEIVGLTYRQLDWWIRRGTIPTTVGMTDPGSGNLRLIPRWYLPRIKLLTQIRRSLPGAHGSTLHEIFTHYEDGKMEFDGFTLTWEVESHEVAFDQHGEPIVPDVFNP